MSSSSVSMSSSSTSIILTCVDAAGGAPAVGRRFLDESARERALFAVLAYLFEAFVLHAMQLQLCG